jgi:hypothetical protein
MVGARMVVCIQARLGACVPKERKLAGINQLGNILLEEESNWRFGERIIFLKNVV